MAGVPGKNIGRRPRGVPVLRVLRRDRELRAADATSTATARVYAGGRCRRMPLPNTTGARGFGAAISPVMRMAMMRLALGPALCLDVNTPRHSHAATHTHMFINQNLGGGPNPGFSRIGGGLELFLLGGSNNLSGSFEDGFDLGDFGEVALCGFGEAPLELSLGVVAGFEGTSDTLGVLTRGMCASDGFCTSGAASAFEQLGLGLGLELHMHRCT